ncbi:hypothetical protein DUT91_24205 [Phyllobacterium salinisoli]|uniref:Uncharacterized protein n=1 Tax=Phyllobacterium salinisoli TaxID=1899321 RepID=A0A368JWU3_9HYPH|nr:hypothetical protein DUT91_24205 [Phyllobacterium salinisoli]
MPLEANNISAQLAPRYQMLNVQYSNELAYTLRVASQLQKRLLVAQTDAGNSQTERAMSNADIRQRMGKLVGRFSLVFRLIQSIN